MTEFNLEIRHRRSIRLKGYDYSQTGAYFVTITTYQRDLLFGDISDGALSLNKYGEFVQSCWEHISEHFPRIQPDAFVVMPNHIHGILLFLDVDVGARHALPLRRDFGKPPPDSLPAVIGSFKSAATRGINLLRGTPAASVWQLLRACRPF